MLFNSVVFLLFAAVFFGFWPLARRRRQVRFAYLTTASFIFYGWWDWRFLFLILGSGLIDYSAGLAMDRWPNRRRFWLIASILGNIGSLGIFKYLGFFTRSINDTLWFFGIAEQIPVLSLTLPVGISFYTFQSMSYTIDIYRGQLRPTRNLLHFFAYLSMFPQLVAGPIIRAADLLPQIEEQPPATRAMKWEGLRLIVHGYFKKMVIADQLAVFINEAFSAPQPIESAVYWWLIVSMFAFQIYCDFSGYSDIARGLARWMGYDFMLNFDHPYIATSIRDFWRRWHISLSTWFRDYVYIPLGGSRGGSGNAHLNMWITMVVSGLWHGANWTFIIWGALHALYLSLERITRWPERLGELSGGRILAWLFLLFQVWIAWVFFRAQSFDQAVWIVQKMLDPTNLDFRVLNAISLYGYAFLALAAVREMWFFFGFDRFSQNRWIAALEPAQLALMIAACIYLRGPGAQFIYFVF